MMIPIYNLTQISMMNPVQWEFTTTDNRYGYIRYRWGRLMIKISNPDGNIDNCFDNPEYSQNIQIGDEFDENIE